MRPSSLKSVFIALRIRFARIEVSLSERAALRVRTNVSPGTVVSLPSASFAVTSSAFAIFTSTPSCTFCQSDFFSLSPSTFRCPRGAPTRYLYPLSRISFSVFSVGTPLSISQRLPIFPYFSSSRSMNGICVSRSLVFPGMTS